MEKYRTSLEISVACGPVLLAAELHAGTPQDERPCGNLDVECPVRPELRRRGSTACMNAR